jgi:G3E family GTPase
MRNELKMRHMERSVARDPLAGKLPVTLITGYLGSGKTTLLARLLRHPGMQRSAVIINEFGEVGIDHELIGWSSEHTTLLPNGCLCCAVRTDLQETLHDLFARRRAGEVIDFDRVFVEASGLADPVPVLHTLRTDGLLGAHYRLDAVVTLVDAVNGMAQLASAPEARRQAAVADRIVLTKTDLAPDEDTALLEEHLAALNPYAARARAVNGELDPGFLRDVGPRSVRTSAPDLERWLSPHAASRGDAARRGAYLGERTGAAFHDASIRSFCLWFEQPFSWDAFTGALQLVVSLRGADLLRVKGLVNVQGEPGPVVVQGSQHLFHPPVTLDAWPTPDRRSRIVFIARNLEQGAVAQLLSAAAQVLPAQG